MHTCNESGNVVQTFVAEMWNKSQPAMAVSDSNANELPCLQSSTSQVKWIRNFGWGQFPYMYVLHRDESTILSTFLFGNSTR